jgi:hypothetical protein
MRGYLVRRLLAVCAVTVMIFATVAAVRLTRVASVSATGPGSLEFNGLPVLAGCPLGPAITFCDQIPGTTGNDQAGFQVKAISAVSGLSVSLAPLPGMSANLAAGCTTAGPCDFTIVTNSCTGTLASGAVCNITVAFTPTTSGLREAVLTITDGAADMLSVNIEGTGAPLSFLLPAPLVCPGQLPDNAFQYCVEPIGATSGTQTFTLVAANMVTGLNVTIAGQSSLASEFNGAQPDFAITGTTCAGTLPALTPCTVGVAFTPQTAGLRAAALTATDNEGDAVAILLAGTTSSGLVITPAGGSVSSCKLPPGIDFCNEPTAGSTASQAYTLTNTSGTQVTGVTILPPLPTTQPPPPPANFTVTSTSCASTLAAGATCTINVAFTPLNTGLQQGFVVATDTQGDVGAINFAGVGDDFSLQIVDGQSPEVTVSQGNTATFMAQLNADSVFGQNGEMVTMSCPRNLPSFTTCSYTPCPITPVIGGSVPFSVLIATSTKLRLTPEVPNPCDTPNAASSVPGARGPNGILRIVRDRPLSASRFPALLAVFLTLALLLVALGLSTTSALPSLGTSARRALVAFGMISFAGALLACSSNNGPSTATPIGVSPMNVIASATDANGNSINAGRGLQITLDVIKQVQINPLP